MMDNRGNLPHSDPYAIKRAGQSKMVKYAAVVGAVILAKHVFKWGWIKSALIVIGGGALFLFVTWKS